MVNTTLMRGGYAGVSPYPMNDRSLRKTVDSCLNVSQQKNYVRVVTIGIAECYQHSPSRHHFRGAARFIIKELPHLAYLKLERAFDLHEAVCAVVWKVGQQEKLFERDLQHCSDVLKFNQLGVRLFCGVRKVTKVALCPGRYCIEDWLGISQHRHPLLADELGTCLVRFNCPCMRVVRNTPSNEGNCSRGQRTDSGNGVEDVLVILDLPTPGNRSTADSACHTPGDPQPSLVFLEHITSIFWRAS